MLFLKFLAAVLIAAPTASCLTISDERVRNLDTTPTVGRGYSVMTDTFHSICLQVDQTTVPSFNYDYNFQEFISQQTSSERKIEVEKKFSASFGKKFFLSMAAEVGTETDTTTEAKIKRFTAASMRIERYYESAREEVSQLSGDAIALLQARDYVGFFHSCGVFYVRGIRRAQEMAASFTFESQNKRSAIEYARDIHVVNWKVTKKRKKKKYNRRNGNEDETIIESDVESYSSRVTIPKYIKEESTLKVDIKGFGFGLKSDGSESLIVSSVEDYIKVLRFAYDVMTRPNMDSFGTGLVYGIEVIPWSNNASFQASNTISDEVILVPIERSVIPKAYRIGNEADTNFDNTNAASRAQFRCKNASFEKDQWGYCCTGDQLFDYSNGIYDSTNPYQRVCRPIRTLNSEEMRENMVMNGEFVVRLENAIRMKMNEINVLQGCIAAVSSLPNSYMNRLLRSNPRISDPEALQMRVSALEVKLAIDPFNDYGLVKHLVKELEEYNEMFVQPCYHAIYGSENRDNRSTETYVSGFLAAPWFKHDACKSISCIAKGWRWDRANRGCVSSITQDASLGYDGEDYCSKVESDDGAILMCKHPTSILSDYQTRAHRCWSNTLQGGNTVFYLDTFCEPITNEFKLTNSEQQELERKARLHCDYSR